jgi:hypothetical protein
MLPTTFNIHCSVHRNNNLLYESQQDAHVTEFIHHRHKHPGLGHLAHSISRVTVALSIISLVSQLFSFIVGCGGVILNGFGFVTFFAVVKASSFCIHLSCLVCSLSVVCGEWSHLICGHKGHNLPEFILSDNCSTCFRHYYHPSSVVCCYHGRVRTLPQ